ncbi:hypothetical protein GCM10008957_39480 [Deinococcus ruber]|uniref:Uncharacterized protein n=1 Tax=Deinococcus ruber TaxID=1848197 RepID=A0A918CIS4_9DEIO|nr:hypothetical protein GCM10008957_39480 [Deinococcus ruber]
MEALVLRTPWKTLFTNQEVETAEERLHARGETAVSPVASLVAMAFEHILLAATSGQHRRAAMAWGSVPPNSSAMLATPSR